MRDSIRRREKGEKVRHFVLFKKKNEEITQRDSTDLLSHTTYLITYRLTPEQKKK